MWHKIANIILRNRFFILGAITLMTVFFGYYAATALKKVNLRHNVSFLILHSRKKRLIQLNEK